MRCFAFAVIIWAIFTSPARGDYLYASNDGDGNVYQIFPTGVTTVLAQPEASSRIWMSTDGIGNLYVNNPGTVWKLGGGQSTVFAHVDGFNALIAADRSGNVYLGNINNNTVNKFTSDGASSWTVRIAASGVAADKNQNLFVVGLSYYYQLLGLMKVAPDGTVSGYYSSSSLTGQPAVDSAGDVFVLSTSGSLLEIAPDKFVTTLVSGLRKPSAVAVDSFGAVYVTEDYQNQSGQWVSSIDIVENGVATPFAILPGSYPVGITGLAVTSAPVTIPEPVLGAAAMAAVALIRRRKS